VPSSKPRRAAWRPIIQSLPVHTSQFKWYQLIVVDTITSGVSFGTNLLHPPHSTMSNSGHHRTGMAGSDPDRQCISP